MAEKLNLLIEEVRRAMEKREMPSNYTDSWRPYKRTRYIPDIDWEAETKLIGSCTRCGIMGTQLLPETRHIRDRDIIRCTKLDLTYCKTCHNLLHRKAKTPKGRLACEI